MINTGAIELQQKFEYRVIPEDIFDFAFDTCKKSLEQKPEPQPQLNIEDKLNFVLISTSAYFDMKNRIDSLEKRFDNETLLYKLDNKLKDLTERVEKIEIGLKRKRGGIDDSENPNKCRKIEYDPEDDIETEEEPDDIVKTEEEENTPWERIDQVDLNK